MNDIKTGRLLIRDFRESDGNDLYEYLSDPVVAHSDGHEPFDREAAYAEAKRRSGDENFRAVCLGDKLIGNIWLCPGDFGTFELGYVFNRAFWGKGYALESARAVVSDAFENRGALRVIAMCNPDNRRSKSLMERLGMRREGHFKKNIYFFSDNEGNPIWLDTYQYAVLKEEFKEADSSSHVEKAKELFLNGYNCSQAVFAAFCDVTGYDLDDALKLSSSFGGGMGRMREVCGACSGMFMVAGALFGYSKDDNKAKAEHYALIQSMAGQFRDRFGSIVCRDILKNTKTDSSPSPTERTEDFYKSRPCLRCIVTAAEIIEEVIKKNT